MATTPDSKHGTGDLDRPRTGSVAGALDHRGDSLGDDGRATAAARADQLGRAGVAVRPDDATWSVPEYACRARDAYRLFDACPAHVLAEGDPAFADWDQDAAAVVGRYDLPVPATVRTGLPGAAVTVDTRLDAVGGGGWDRSGRRSDGSRITVGTLGTSLVHDPVDQLWDVRTGR